MSPQPSLIVCQSLAFPGAYTVPCVFPRHGPLWTPPLPTQPQNPHRALQVTPSSVAFWGLAVRMGVATGRVTHTTTHPLTRRTVYHGPLVQLVGAVVGVAHGGQIVTESSTFMAMSPALGDIAQRVPPQPDYDALVYRPRCACSFCTNTGTDIDPALTTTDIDTDTGVNTHTDAAIDVFWAL